MWLTKDANRAGWYCSELVWAAYLHASNGTINLEHTPDSLGVSPDEIFKDEDVMVIGGHLEDKPPTLWSLIFDLTDISISGGNASNILSCIVENLFLAGDFFFLAILGLFMICTPLASSLRLQRKRSGKKVVFYLTKPLQRASTGR
jgi:hypothetical protein